jgi:hypothetical protein
VEVPHRETGALRERPRSQQSVVGGLVAFDDVRDDRPIETRMPPPLLDPLVVCRPVGLNTLLPNRERAVVQPERLRHLGGDDDLFGVGEGNEGVAASPDLNRDLPSGMPASMVVDHNRGIGCE